MTKNEMHQTNLEISNLYGEVALRTGQIKDPEQRMRMFATLASHATLCFGQEAAKLGLSREEGSLILFHLQEEMVRVA